MHTFIAHTRLAGSFLRNFVHVLLKLSGKNWPVYNFAASVSALEQQINIKKTSQFKTICKSNSGCKLISPFWYLLF